MGSCHALIYQLPHRPGFYSPYESPVSCTSCDVHPSAHLGLSDRADALLMCRNVPPGGPTLVHCRFIYDWRRDTVQPSSNSKANSGLSI